MDLNITDFDKTLSKVKYFCNRQLKMSYSSFKLIEHCPASYALTSILYMVPKTINQRNFCLGSVGHTCLQMWLMQDKLDIGFMEAIAEDVFDKYLKENTVIPLNRQDIGKMRVKAVVNAKAIEDTFLEFGFINKVLKNETKWQVPLTNFNNVLLTGILDLYLPDENIIYDLKVTESASFMDKDQLCYYGMMGVLDGRKTNKAGFIVPLRKNKVVEIQFTSEDFKGLHNRVLVCINIINSSIKSGKWFYNYDKSKCYGCNVRDVCQAYKVGNLPVDRPMTQEGKIQI